VLFCDATRNSESIGAELVVKNERLIIGVPASLARADPPPDFALIPPANYYWRLI
jgi:hypothetical protein